MNDALSRVRLRPFHDDEVCFGNAPGPPPHIEVASDREAMKMALQEFIVRLMFEHGVTGPWVRDIAKLVADAELAALAEYLAAPINRK